MDRSGTDIGAKRKKYLPLGLAILLLAAVVLLAAAGGTGLYLLSKKQHSLDNSNKQLKTAQSQLQELKKKKQRPVVVFGDTRTNDSIHEKVVNEIYNANPEAVFHLGDAVNDGTKPQEWQVFNRIEDKLISNFNFYIAAGNHDQESALYYDNFALPGNEKWYSVNYQGVHWVVVDSNLDLSPGSPQYSWLEADLAKPRASIKFTALVIHQSLYTSATHAKDNVPYKQSLIDLLQKYHVAVVFSGHDHDYERSYDGKIYYLVCGSAGAPLYEKQYDNPLSQKFVSTYNYCVVDVEGNSLTVTAYDDNSQSIDTVSITAH